MKKRKSPVITGDFVNGFISSEPDFNTTSEINYRKFLMCFFEQLMMLIGNALTVMLAL